LVSHIIVIDFFFLGKREQFITTNVSGLRKQGQFFNPFSRTFCKFVVFSVFHTYYQPLTQWENRRIFDNMAL